MRAITPPTKNFIVSLFLVCLWVFPASAAVQSREAAELNNQGVLAAKEGRFEDAAALLRKALTLEPSSPEASRNLSSILLEWSIQIQQGCDHQQAMQILEEAVNADARNAPAWFMLGDLYYLRKSDLKNALIFWKNSLENAPPDKRQLILGRITRVETDLQVERNFAMQETPHFLIRFESGAQISNTEKWTEFFENSYNRLAADLSVSPPKLTVIIYPPGKFERLNGAKDWAIGFYDGRIRMRQEDLEAEHGETVFIHELAHAFLHHGFKGFLPAWIHEGFAQMSEPDRTMSASEEALEQGLRDRTHWIPLEWLDRRFTQPTSVDDVNRAYAEARLAVSYLVETYGWQRFRAFLEALSKGGKIGQIFDEVFRPAKWSRFNQGSLSP